MRVVSAKRLGVAPLPTHNAVAPLVAKMIAPASRVVTATKAPPVDNSCVGVLCPPGLTCVQGACIDLSCAGVLCPGGGTCSQGVCSTVPAQQPASTPVTTHGSDNTTQPAPVTTDDGSSDGTGSNSLPPVVSGKSTTKYTRQSLPGDVYNPGDQSTGGAGTDGTYTPPAPANPIGMLGLAAAAAVFLFKIKLVF